MANFLRIAIIMCMCVTYKAFSIDLGVQGHIYPIVEVDLLERIQQEIKKEGLGSVHEFVRVIHSDGYKLVAVKGVGETVSSRIFYHDPTIIIHEDIRDHLGKVILAKGTKYNPLEQYHLAQGLLFFDGTQEEHVEWADSKWPEAKWVLVKGDPFLLEKKYKRPIYFDQSGPLCKKLNIARVPAVVSQEGNLLRIEEVPVRGWSRND